MNRISAEYDLHSEDIPKIDYNEEERMIWKRNYRKLIEVQERCAPQLINQNFKRLAREVGMSAKNMPQLDDISKFHIQWSGWRLRPVFGLLTLEEFLNQLAFKIWPATQYVRPRTGELYNPEPDFIHEVFGHQALLMIPKCQKTLHQMGIASLGAS